MGHKILDCHNIHPLSHVGVTWANPLRRAVGRRAVSGGRERRRGREVGAPLVATHYQTLRIKDIRERKERRYGHNPGSVFFDQILAAVVLTWVVPVPVDLH